MAEEIIVSSTKRYYVQHLDWEWVDCNIHIPGYANEAGARKVKSQLKKQFEYLRIIKRTIMDEVIE